MGVCEKCGSEGNYKFCPLCGGLPCPRLLHTHVQERLLMLHKKLQPLPRAACSCKWKKPSLRPEGPFSFASTRRLTSPYDLVGLKRFQKLMLCSIYLTPQKVMLVSCLLLISGPGWKKKRGWNKDLPLSSWDGAFCYCWSFSFHGKALSLMLPGRLLKSGSVTTSLQELSPNLSYVILFLRFSNYWGKFAFIETPCSLKQCPHWPHPWIYLETLQPRRVSGQHEWNERTNCDSFHYFDRRGPFLRLLAFSPN